MSSNCSTSPLLTVLVAVSLAVPGFSENCFSFPTLLLVAWQHTHYSSVSLTARDTRAWAMVCSTCQSGCDKVLHISEDSCLRGLLLSDWGWRVKWLPVPTRCWASGTTVSFGVLLYLRIWSSEMEISISFRSTKSKTSFVAKPYDGGWKGTVIKYIVLSITSILDACIPSCTGHN